MELKRCHVRIFLFTTQGDPLAMAMYAVGTQPLIRRLDGIATQVWYADDSASGSSLERLRRWWDLLVEVGPLYGYFPNGSKTHVLAKPLHVEAARVKGGVPRYWNSHLDGG